MDASKIHTDDLYYAVHYYEDCNRPDPSPCCGVSCYHCPADRGFLDCRLLAFDISKDDLHKCFKEELAKRPKRELAKANRHYQMKAGTIITER